MKIMTYSIQVAVPDDIACKTVTSSLNAALTMGAGWLRHPGWDLGQLIPQGGEVIVPDAGEVRALHDSHAVDDSYVTP